jgi:hypothetical protein
MNRGAMHWKWGNRRLRLVAALLGAGLLWSVLTPVGGSGANTDGRDRRSSLALAGSAKAGAGTEAPGASDGGSEQRTQEAPPGSATSVAFPLCGANDTPETGIQGDMPRVDQESRRADHGYNCGLLVVGHNDLGGFGGGALARAGRCAFTTTRGGGGGIKVVDMTDPTDPRVVDMPDLPTFGSSENMHAVVAEDRAVLSYGRGIYDVSACTDRRVALGGEHVPKVLGDLTFSDKPIGSPHNVKLSPDGTKVVGTMPLTIADISDLTDPSTWEVRYLQCEVAKQTDPVATDAAGFCDIVKPSDVHALTMPRPQLAHEPEFSADGTRLYIAGQRQSDWFGRDLPGVYKRDEYMTVLDITGDVDDPGWPRVISQTFGAGHGMQSITIGGRPYLMHSNEGGTPGAECKPEGSPTPGVADSNAQVYLTDIDDETAPTTVSSMRLAINTPEPGYCAAQLDSNLGPTCRMAASAASRGCVSTAHYHSVDDPTDATFAMLSMTSAGLRIWDIRDPAKPQEVAYWSAGQTSNDQGCVGLFVAGGVAAGGQCGVDAMHGTTVYDPIGAYAHYDADTGYIWVNTRAGGFWVLRLEEQVRDALGLRHISYPRQPDSAPAKPNLPGISGGSRAMVAPASVRGFCDIEVASAEVPGDGRSGEGAASLLR